MKCGTCGQGEEEYHDPDAHWRRHTIGYDISSTNEGETRGIRASQFYMPPRTWTNKERADFQPKLTKFLEKHGYKRINEDEP